MFSMSALAWSPALDSAELARFGVLHGTEALLPSRAVLRLGWEEMERALPDGGLPRGVVELAAVPLARLSRASGTTTIAIAAMSAVHASDAHAWCAWINPIPSLYAPALAQAGVDLDRLLVVRPSPQALARTAVKVAMSGAFEVVVVDALHHHRPFGLSAAASGGPQKDLSGAPKDNGAVVVRKLALAAEECGTTSLLLTSALAPRAVPWPVALRVEVERRPDALSLRITKDRRGCGSSQHVVRLP
jgi:recombination protein RecA